MLRRIPHVAASARRTPVPARNLHYDPPLREIKFLFNDVFDMQKHWGDVAKKYPTAKHLPEDCSPDMVDSIMEASSDFAVQELLPLYQAGDKDGAKYDPKTADVTVTPGFEAAYKSYGEQGWGQLSIPQELGGQNLPTTLNMAKTEFVATANWAWGMYPGLTTGAINTLLLHGGDEMRQKYVPKMASGEWSGTMCLTEPQCGTDLGLIKTKAEVVDEPGNKYKLTGMKIFISCGEHDMSDNIIHIALAKLPGAPDGVKGISLFLVPKYTDAEMAKPKAERKKNIKCAGIESKMGIHGSSTCTMAFEDSEGYLIGLPNDGLRQMFTFMNTARLGVSLQGVAHSELAYQNAYRYAIERRCMSPLSGRVDPTKPADTLIHLPEIRRMLLTARVVADAGRHMVLKCAKIADEMMYSKDKKEIKRLEDNMGWYTPVAKGFITELSLEATSNCMQVFGGHGYVRDHGMEQIYRDARIGTMYEGTTSIQALDLIGRKMFREKFRQFRKWVKDLAAFAGTAARVGGKEGQHGRAMMKAIFQYSKAVGFLAMHVAKGKKNHDAITANAFDNLHAVGFLMVGEAFLRQRQVAEKKLKTDGLSDEDKLFLEGKIETVDFFFERMFPRVYGHIGIMRNVDDTVTNIKKHDQFVCR
eukprot:TRINITY_DN95_c0_g1_i1.p1 TRINITY_DN95_c0_g1~~TRINITY_DN95_c0_g1_i1.p1  ORF type:complete len:690 (+),score=184.60 TRINITY_DN95_c0_g1_i1:142-2070(+)